MTDEICSTIKLSPEEKMTKSRNILLRRQPWFANILVHLEFEIVDDHKVMPTACNHAGYKILFGRDFLNVITLEETVWVLAHEVCHSVFGHMSIRSGKGKDPRLANQAMDFAINDILYTDGFGAPIGCDRDLFLKGDKEKFPTMFPTKALEWYAVGKNL